MGQSFFDKIQAKLELFRLEQRYTRRRHRRSTFVSNAIYVDGEYVYQTPNSTGSSTGSSKVNALHSSDPAVSPSPTPEPASVSSSTAERERKRLNRFSSMPGFGGSFNSKEMPRVQERRTSMIR